MDTSPGRTRGRLVARLARRFRSARTARSADRPAGRAGARVVPPSRPALGSTAHVLDGLDDRDLCQVWRSSHHRLQAASSSDQAAACVRLRQLVLDELESRHPEAVAAWVAGGADRTPAFLPGRDQHRGRDT